MAVSHKGLSVSSMPLLHFVLCFGSQGLVRIPQPRLLNYVGLVLAYFRRYLFLDLGIRCVPVRRANGFSKAPLFESAVSCLGRGEYLHVGNKPFGTVPFVTLVDFFDRGRGFGMLPSCMRQA